MKVKTLSRSISAHQPAGSDVAKQPKNMAAGVHPFERAREYKRASHLAVFPTSLVVDLH